MELIRRLYVRVGKRTKDTYRSQVVFQQKVWGDPTCHEKGVSKLEAFSANHEGFPAWRDKFAAVCEGLSLLDFTEGNVKRPSGGGGLSGGMSLTKEGSTVGTHAVEDYDSKNIKLYSKLLVATKGDASTLVCQFKEARDGINRRRSGLAAYRALVNKCELTGNVQKATLQQKLRGDTLGSDEDPDARFFRLERNRGQLQRLGVTTTDEVLLATVLSKVPSKYERLVDLVILDDESLS